jgi:hypothetical protein
MQNLNHLQKCSKWGRGGGVDGEGMEERIRGQMTLCNHCDLVFKGH